MGDAGEGLVDAESRIQERQDEIALERAQRREKAASGPQNVEAKRELESLKMARAEFERQLNTPAYERRWPAIKQGIEDIDKLIAALKAKLG